MTALIRAAKKAYFSKLITEDKSTSQLWQAMNEITNKTRHKQPNTKHKFSADEHNDFFLSQADTINRVGLDLCTPRHISSTSTAKLIHFCETKTCKAFNIPPMTVHDVGRYILQLNNKRSMDTQNLNSSFLKLSLPYISSPLTYIYNLCLAKYCFPATFKSAKVIPLAKSKDTDNIENYRPISILPILSKPLEKHIHYYLSQYMEENDLFYKLQSGFRPKHSCHTALTRLCDTWLGALNNHNVVGSVFLDLRKAFDLVDHDILVQKLQLYLGNHAVSSLFISYLSSRTQAVYCNGTISKTGKLACGVPQGSILGPLLFCIYINDLPLYLRHNDVFLDLFADDNTLHCSNKNITIVQTHLQDSIDDVHYWCHINRMVIHPQKTKCMLISTRQKHQLQPLRLDLYINLKKNRASK